MEADQQVKIVKTKYLACVKPDLTFLTAQELKHIDSVLTKYSDKTAMQMSEISRKDIPWIAAKIWEILDYEAVFYRNEDTSVREYSEV
jgi:uncharacterized phage-associated protein